MTTSVDTRVVQMQFDNASFQKGVSETLSSLENLSNKLDTKKGFSILGGLKSTLGNLGFESVGSGLDGLLSRASTVFSGLTSMAANFASTLLSISGIAGVVFGGGALYQAITGGSQRATNIENAKFQIEGLKKDWTQLSEDINYAVLDTAYGFDAAAMAAAQFSASGIQAGNDMKTALRSISGVAAMTNSDYSSIASIFTTVAGQGKLMTMQLRQLEARGLNAAAILGEQLGKSEAEIREMVTEGEIDFKTFSNAMDEAFGEHAKEANKTFTGAVANMKAALSKIGADFIMPFHEFERQVALGFKAIFDSIRAGLELERPIYHLVESGGELTRVFAGNMSIVSTFGKNFEALGKRIMDIMTEFKESQVMQAAVADWLYIFDAWVSGTTNIVGTFVESVFKKLMEIDTYPLAMALRNIGQALYVVLERVNQGVPTIVDILGNLFGAFANIAEAVSTIVFPIFEALYEVFMGFSKVDGAIEFNVLDNLLSASQKIKDFTESLGLTEEEMVRVKEMFVSVFTKIGTAIISIAGPAFDLFSNVAHFIGDALSDLISWFASLSGPVDNASSSIQKLSGFLGWIISGIASAVPSWQSFRDAIASVLEFLSQMAIFEDLEINPFDGVESKAENFFAGLSALVVGFVNTVIQAFGNIGKAVSSAMGEAFGYVMDSLKSMTFPDILAMGLFPSLLGFISSFSATLWKLAEKLNNFNFLNLSGLSNVNNVLIALKNTLYSTTMSLRMASLVAFAVSIGILALALHKLSELDDASLRQGLIAVLGLGEVLAMVMMSIERFVLDPKTLAGLSKIGGSFVGLALGILILAGAVKALSAIDAGDMWKAIGAITALAGVMAGMTILMSKYTSGNFVNGAGLLLMANSMVVLALAVKILSTIPLENMGTALLGLGGMIAGMTMSLMALSELGGKVPFAAFAMQSMATALLELSVAVLVLSTIPIERMAVALFGLVGALVALVGPILLMGSIEKSMIGMSAAMLTTGAMILALAVSLKLLSTISMESMVTALVGLAGAMVILASAAMIMGGAGGLAGAAGILGIAVALTLLAPALAVLSTIPLESVGSTILLLAGALTVLGLAAVLIPAPAMLALAASLLAIGVGAAAVGAGVALAGAGMLAFATALGIIAVMAPLAGAGIIGMAKAIITGLMGMTGEIATLAVESITAFIETLASNAARLAEAGKSLITTLLTGLLSGLPEMTGMVVTLIISMINALNEQAVSLVAAGLSLLTNLLMGVASGIGEVTNAAIQVALMFIIGVADGLRENVSIIRAAVIDTFNTIGSVVLTLIADLLDSIGLGITGIPDMIRGKAGEMSAAAEEASQAAHSEVNQACAEITADTESTFGGLPDIISGNQGDIEGAAGDLFSGVSASALSEMGVAEGAVDGEMGGIVSTISGYSGAAGSAGNSVGTAAGSQMTSGFKSSSGDFKSIAQSAVNGVTNVDTSGAYSVGSNLGAGLYNGMSSWSWSIASKASSLVSSAISAMRNAGAIFSPSRKTAEIGGYLTEGLVNGMLAKTALVATASRELIGQVTEPLDDFARSAYSALDSIDWDANPVITPVLDLSQIESGMGMFDGLFPSTQLVTASAIDRSMGSTRALEGGGNVRYGDQYHFNLQYDAGADATDIVMGMARSMRTRSLLEG